MTTYKVHRLESEIEFGKYKGKTIEEIIRKDPTYLVWCLDQIDGFYLDEEADSLLDLELDYLEDSG